MTNERKKVIEATAILFGLALFALVLTLSLQSCNVTRVITNQSEYYQRGDTSVMIQTKTIETYDASKKGL